MHGKGRALHYGMVTGSKGEATSHTSPKGVFPPSLDPSPHSDCEPQCAEVQQLEPRGDFLPPCTRNCRQSQHSAEQSQIDGYRTSVVPVEPSSE